MNILLVFVFVGAVMENVAARFFAAPLAMIGLTALAFALAFAVLGLTALIFARAGAERQLCAGADGLAAQYGADAGGDRRSAAGFHLAGFALAQFPAYLSPLLLSPLARRVKQTLVQVPARSRE